MQTIRALLVDDEKNNCENLQYLLSEYCPEVEVVGKCYNAGQAYRAIYEQKPNLLFLDIEMPGGSGFDLLEQVKGAEFSVIFVTAYDQYAIKALRLSAIDYLLKPIHILELQNAVAKVCSEIESSKTSNQLIENYQGNSQREGQMKQIALPTSDRIVFIKIGEIVRCQGEANYTHIVLENGETHLVSKNLREYEELLSKDGFIRVHQSHLVNSKQIRSYEKREGGYLKMNNGDTVSLSRRRKEEVLAELRKS